jgi:hypothetical protein
MVAELNEIWGIDDKCDKIMEHIKNCPECQKKIFKLQQPIVENFQVEPNNFPIKPNNFQVEPNNFPVEQRKMIKIKEKEKDIDIDIIDKLFEYSDIILIGLTIYLILKAL